MAQPVRGTQTLVDQMGWVFARPSLVAFEIAWRWLFGAPFLYVCWRAAQGILTALPPESTGLTSIDPQNPWIAAVQFADVWARYQPSAYGALEWILPIGAIVWIIFSGAGRTVVLKRLDPQVRIQPLPMMCLQAAWLVLLAMIVAGWFLSMQWVATTHITSNGEADLVGYSIWAIFLSLGFFTLWAIVNWPLAVAPTLMALENRSAASALSASFRLGKAFTGKLMEANLVMGIVKLALIVLAMVFSAAPLPFSDQLGPDAMHFVWAGATIFYLVASDYFHVVKLKGFVEFWQTYRGALNTSED